MLHLFIRMSPVPAERHFVHRKHQGTNPEPRHPPGKRVQASAGHGPGRPGGSSALPSAGQQPSRSLSPGSPIPARSCDRALPSLDVRRGLIKKYDIETISLMSRSHAKPQWPGSVLSRRTGVKATDGRDWPVSRGSRSVGRAVGSQGGRRRDMLPTRGRQRPSPLLPAGFAGETRHRLEN